MADEAAVVEQGGGAARPGARWVHVTCGDLWEFLEVQPLLRFLFDLEPHAGEFFAVPNPPHVAMPFVSLCPHHYS